MSSKGLYDVIASYPYTAKSERELSLAKNETLTVLKEYNQWLFVQNSIGKRGMIPLSYTRRADNIPPPSTAPPAASANPAAKTVAAQPQAAKPAAQPQAAAQPAAQPAAQHAAKPSGKNKHVMATKAVIPTNDGHLALKEGDVIEVLEEFPTGWLRGQLNGKVGLVPPDAVRPCEAVAAKVLYHARALFDYNPSQEGQLTFKKGDVLAIMKDDLPGGWWLAELNGKPGHVPKSYCKKIEHKKRPPSVIGSKINAETRP